MSFFESKIAAWKHFKSRTCTVVSNLKFDGFPWAVESESSIGFYAPLPSKFRTLYA